MTTIDYGTAEITLADLIALCLGKQVEVRFGCYSDSVLTLTLDSLDAYNLARHIDNIKEQKND